MMASARTTSSTGLLLLPPRELLAQARAVLGPLLERMGCRFRLLREGVSSRGAHAMGEYFRGIIAVRLYVSTGLDRVEYCVGEARVEHSVYMRCLEVGKDSLYPR